MTDRDGVFSEAGRSRTPLDRRVPRPVEPHRKRPLSEEAELKAVARDEGWLVPPAEVTRVALRPWQQAVFWGLRVYIVVMLTVLAIGFAHVAAG